MADTRATPIPIAGRDEDEARLRLDGEESAVALRGDGAEHLDQREADSDPQDGAHHPQDPRLIEKDQPGPGIAHAQGFEDAYLPGLLHRRDGERRRDAEHDGHDHEHLDHDGRRALTLQRGQKIGVGLLPVGDLDVRELRRYLRGHLLGGEDVVYLHLYRADLVRRTAQRLTGLLQPHEDRLLVDRLGAQVEDAFKGRGQPRAVGQHEFDGVARHEAVRLHELLAKKDVAAGAATPARRSSCRKACRWSRGPRKSHPWPRRASRSHPAG